MKDLISKALSNGPPKGSASWSEEERESAAKRKRALQSKTKIKERKKSKPIRVRGVTKEGDDMLDAGTANERKSQVGQINKHSLARQAERKDASAAYEATLCLLSILDFFVQTYCRPVDDPHRSLHFSYFQCVPI